MSYLHTWFNPPPTPGLSEGVPPQVKMVSPERLPEPSGHIPVEARLSLANSTYVLAEANKTCSYSWKLTRNMARANGLSEAAVLAIEYKYGII